MFDTLSDKNIIFFPEKGFFSSWDFILKQWRRGQHWRKLKVRFRFTETPFLPNHRTLPKPRFCQTSKPKPKFRSYTSILRKNLGHSRTLIDLFLSSNFGFLYEKRIKEYFQRVDESIGIHPLTLWSALNAPYLSDGFDFSYMNPLGLGLIDSLDMYVFERSK